MYVCVKGGNEPGVCVQGEDDPDNWDVSELFGAVCESSARLITHRVGLPRGSMQP